jgi:hypothetical protein
LIAGGEQTTPGRFRGKLRAALSILDLSTSTPRQTRSRENASPTARQRLDDGAPFHYPSSTDCLIDHPAGRHGSESVPFQKLPLPSRDAMERVKPLTRRAFHQPQKRFYAHYSFRGRFALQRLRAIEG